MTALHEQTDWPCATSTAEDRELQPSETQPSETLSDVARKQSKYWNYVEGIQHYKLSDTLQTTKASPQNGSNELLYFIYSPV